jgi:hypothetical protein
MSQDTSHYGDNFIPIIESDMIHTAEHPFCPDPACPCHEDQELIQDVQTTYVEGLVTSDEATRIVEGMSLG